MYFGREIAAPLACPPAFQQSCAKKRNAIDVVGLMVSMAAKAAPGAEAKSPHAG